MNRIQQVEEKYPEFAQRAVEIADKNHNGKYLLWIAAQLSKKNDPSDIQGTVDGFHRNGDRLQYKDIYKYSDLKVLENELKSLDLSSRKKKKRAKESGARKIYEDDKFLITRIYSKEAMILYGKNTRWCIAMENGNYWENYNWNGSTFYVLINKNDNKKFCVSKKDLLKLTIWSEEDYRVDLENVISPDSQEGFPFELLIEILKDREPNIWKEICDRTADPEKVSNWLKNQPNSTKTFLKSNAFVYTITKKTRTLKDNIRGDDLRFIKEKRPEVFSRIIYLLKKSPQSYIRLRHNIGIYFPELRRELFECDIDFRNNKSASVKVLLSGDFTLRKKGLELASPEMILYALREEKDQYRQGELVKVLLTKTTTEEVLSTLCPLIPKNKKIPKIQDRNVPND